MKPLGALLVALLLNLQGDIVWHYSGSQMTTNDPFSTVLRTFVLSSPGEESYTGLQLVWDDANPLFTLLFGQVWGANEYTETRFPFLRRLAVAHEDAFYSLAEVVQLRLEVLEAEKEAVTDARATIAAQKIRLACDLAIGSGRGLNAITPG